MLPVLPRWQRVALALRLLIGNITVVRVGVDRYPRAEVHRFEVLGYRQW